MEIKYRYQEIITSFEKSKATKDVKTLNALIKIVQDKLKEFETPIGVPNPENEKKWQLLMKQLKAAKGNFK
jgi:hypothetical protein